MTRQPMDDLRNINPEDLDGLDDITFRLVVDADIRRSTGSASPVSAAVGAALRAKHLQRWHTTLLQMERSVSGQLESRAEEYEWRVSQLRSRELRVRNNMPAEGEEGVTLLDIEMDTEKLKGDHLRSRTGSLRFKAGLDQVLIEADSLLGPDLGRAIRRHRQRMQERDLNPTDIDVDLWAVLDEEAG